MKNSIQKKDVLIIYSNSHNFNTIFEKIFKHLNFTFYVANAHEKGNKVTLYKSIFLYLTYYH